MFGGVLQGGRQVKSDCFQPKTQVKIFFGWVPCSRREAVKNSEVNKAGELAASTKVVESCSTNPR